MKHRTEPIDVVLAGGRPAMIRVGARRLRVVCVVDSWVVQGRWWEHEERRNYYRLETRGGVMDVYEGGGQWYLSKVLD